MANVRIRLPTVSNGDIGQYALNCDVSINVDHESNSSWRKRNHSGRRCFERDGVLEQSARLAWGWLIDGDRNLGCSPWESEKSDQKT
jgi:hypothetical protein